MRGMRWALTALLAVVFGWSGLGKLMDPAGFALALFRYHLLPADAINLAALWIMWLELLCVFVLLFLPRFRKAALWLILGLLAVFSCGVAVNLLRGSEIACGCFSTSPFAPPADGWSLLRNCGLALAAMFLLAAPSRSGTAPPC